MQEPGPLRFWFTRNYCYGTTRNCLRKINYWGKPMWVAHKVFVKQVTLRCFSGWFNFAPLPKLTPIHDQASALGGSSVICLYFFVANCLVKSNLPVLVDVFARLFGCSLRRSMDWNILWLNRIAAALPVCWSAQAVRECVMFAVVGCM